MHGKGKFLNNLQSIFIILNILDENPFGFTPYDDGLMRGNYGFSDRILATQNIITELEEKDEKD